MKTMRLTEKQLLKLWHHKQVRKRFNSNIIYIDNYGDEIEFKDWTGKAVDVKLSDEDMEYLGYMEEDF